MAQHSGSIEIRALIAEGQISIKAGAAFVGPDGMLLILGDASFITDNQIIDVVPIGMSI